MPKPVTSCAFSPDGAFLVTCCQDGTAVIWNTRTGKAASGALGHSQEVVEAAFSPDGKRVATASSDGSAMLWEVPTGQPLSEPLKHNDAVQHVLFADAHTLITASLDQTVRIWELRSPDKPAERVRIAQFAQDIALAQLEPSNRVEPKDPIPSHSLTSIFLPGSHSMNDSAGMFFRWFFDKSNGHTLSPFSHVTIAEYIQSRIKDGTVSSLKEAALLAQGDVTSLEQIDRIKKTRHDK